MMKILQNVKIKFFKDLINIKNINCYSNEGNVFGENQILLF